MPLTALNVATRGVLNRGGCPALNLAMRGLLRKAAVAVQPDPKARITLAGRAALASTRLCDDRVPVVARTPVTARTEPLTGRVATSGRDPLVAETQSDTRRRLAGRSALAPREDK